jgi:hypothetical protein
MSLLLIMFILIGAGGIAFFLRNRDARMKRQLWPWWITVTVFVFLLMAWATGVNALVFLALFLVVVAIGVLAASQVRFCASCGRTVMPARPFIPAKFCDGCRKPLKA